MKGLFERYPKATAARMCEELKDAGYQGGITILRESQEFAASAQEAARHPL